MIKYIFKVIVWQIKHRDEKNNRQKQRRFDKEVGEFKPSAAPIQISHRNGKAKYSKI